MLLVSSPDFSKETVELPPFFVKGGGVKAFYCGRRFPALKLKVYLGSE